MKITLFAPLLVLAAFVGIALSPAPVQAQSGYNCVQDCYLLKVADCFTCHSPHQFTFQWAGTDQCVDCWLALNPDVIIGDNIKKGPALAGLTARGYHLKMAADAKHRPYVHAPRYRTAIAAMQSTCLVPKNGD